MSVEETTAITKCIEWSLSVYNTVLRCTNVSGFSNNCEISCYTTNQILSSLPHFLSSNLPNQPPVIPLNPGPCPSAFTNTSLSTLTPHHKRFNSSCSHAVSSIFELPSPFLIDLFYISLRLFIDRSEPYFRPSSLKRSPFSSGREFH